MDIAEGRCEYPDPHPPHLWGSEMTFPSGAPKIKIWACDGKDEVE
jgi:hypothetical protein